MTFKRPKQWFLRPFYWIARCQSKHWREQQVDGYDVRLWWDSDGKMEFRHGLFAYDAGDWFKFLSYCDDHGKVLRLYLECRSDIMQVIAEEEGLEYKFIDVCQMIEKYYKNIRLTHCQNMHTTAQLYKPRYSFNEIGFYSSVDGDLWYDKLNDLWPWLYAKLHNSSIRTLYGSEIDDDGTCVLMDFVE